MEANSSGEETVIKTRKPYTITKQRERWTDEEHNRFLEALKLYGRAWQRIEEHIGTKTAVQIRSHAQKFFTKLEKEANAKGIPVGQALDIDIPPPRPKRKPSNPYPRKTGNGTPTPQAGAKDGKLTTLAASLHCSDALNSEQGSLTEKRNGGVRPSNTEENQDGNCSECFTLLHEAHCSSVSSSVDKISAPPSVALRNSCTFREFIPSPKQDNGTSKASNFEKSCRHSHDKSVLSVEKNSANSVLPTDEPGTQNYPRHVPVHVLDGRSVTSSPPLNMPLRDSMFHPVGEIHCQSNSFINPTASGTTTEHQNDTSTPAYQALPTFHPAFAPNPAVHAAASYAASFWPDSSADSSTCTQGGFPPGQMSSTPSLAAIAAATVAAATAWWAGHGLLPLCAPFHAAFTFPPQATTHTGQALASKTDMQETTAQNPSVADQHPGPECSEALQAQHSASKSTNLSSSDSEESRGNEPKTGAKRDCHEESRAVSEVHDSSKAKKRKQVDRSSCGSNTPSSSDVETDALEKQKKGKDEANEADAGNSATESCNRRSRSCSNLSDSWKEVSEEVLGQGRLAFQALFSREVLPQSFSPPHGIETKRYQEANTEEEKQNLDKKDGGASILDHNNKIGGTSSDHQVGEKKNTLRTCENNEQQGPLAIGLGNVKLKVRKTGFKPYKRCSVEAKETRSMNTTKEVEETGPKRIRLEGEAST